MASPLLSEVRFGSYLIYSPRGTSEVSIRSRRFRNAIKRGDEPTLKSLVAHLAERVEETELDAVLGSNVVLVPAPRSSLLIGGGLWPARRIADELVSAGVGREVFPCLRRVEAVPKSAFQAAGERPDARRHYETIDVEAQLSTGGRMTIVDDFVTKGNTLLGAASRLAEAYPQVEVSVFALVRTMGLQPEVETLVAPCLGHIRRNGDRANRSP